MPDGPTSLPTTSTNQPIQDRPGTAAEAAAILAAKVAKAALVDAEVAAGKGIPTDESDNLPFDAPTPVA